MIQRAQGALLGLVTGDALGSLVEFMNPQQIREKYPEGLRDIVGGGVYNTLAGQPTDDSEMAITLARSLIEKQGFFSDEVYQAYQEWLKSKPFDVGITISAALNGQMDFQSQGNGALMRVAPIGIFGVNYPLDQVAEWAESDGSLTHPHPICLQVNQLFAMAISYAVKNQTTAKELYDQIAHWAHEQEMLPAIIQVIEEAVAQPPQDYLSQMGWVLIAFQNALFQLLHAPNLVEGVVSTIKRGGDTDTNAAITGALLGALYGKSAIPEQWEKTVLTCRPQEGGAGVFRPRPRQYWAVDLLDVAKKLIAK